MQKKTDLIIKSTSRQCQNLLILSSCWSLIKASHHYILYIILALRLIVILIWEKNISLICRCSFYHIYDLHHIHRYISLSVAQTIHTVFIASRFDNYKYRLYNIWSKDIAKLLCVQKCLSRILTWSPRLIFILFLSWNLRVCFPRFLLHPSPEFSIHLVFTCCLFPGLKLILGLVLFQLLSQQLFGTHSLNMLSHQIV